MTWTPARTHRVDERGLPLSPTHGFVLSRVDGRTDTRTIAHMTGLSELQVEEILRELVAFDVIAAPQEDAAGPGQARTLPEPEDEFVDIDLSFDEPDEAGPEPAAPDTVEPDVAGTHRRLFEQQLRDLPVDHRAALAARASEPELSALCYDPLAVVVRAVLDNPGAGLAHARLVARHHRTTVGLEAVCARAPFAADEGVRRALLLNPILPAPLYRKLWQGRRMLEQFHVAASREVPEQTRRTARDVLRVRFTTATSDERVETIVRTEGRVLVMMTGLTLDGRSTALLCGRPVSSAIYAQNVGRWSAAPPALVAHLLKSELVRRTKALRTLLERHPNAPRAR